MRLFNPRTADEAGYVPIIGAQPAVLFDLLFGRRVDDSEVGLDNDVGYERAIDGGTKAWILTVSD